MKLLWVNPNFLHPTTKGGQIRTLELLRRLSQRHEIHYAAFENPAEPEGLARAGEYSSRVFSVSRQLASKSSPQFYVQAVLALTQAQPLAVSRFRDSQFAALLARLLSEEKYDRVVCDFLVSAVNFDSMRNKILFQHNVETMIWRRRAEQAPTAWQRVYLNQQAAKIDAYERKICHEAGLIMSVSAPDSGMMQNMFDIRETIPEVPTGVDVNYFTPPAAVKPKAEPPCDLLFVGSMDWFPNIEGIEFFVEQVLPLIRRQRPQTTLTIVGRSPEARIRALAEKDSLIRVTGTVDDVRPYLWAAAICVVPLRIGGGTRIKIYESMAAKTPVVSTTIGAEGLPLQHPHQIRIADSPEDLAAQCLRLLENEEERHELARTGFELVTAQFSWEAATDRLETILKEAPAYSGS